MIRHPNGFASWLPAGWDGQFHWDFLIPALPYAPGKFCEPMDFDCVIERNGLFLIFETKQPGVKIKRGQEITLSRMVHLGRGAVTVIGLQAKCPTEIEGWEVWRYTSRGPTRCVHEGNAQALFDFVQRWWAHASTVLVPPVFAPRIERADLFTSLIESPVECATIHLQRLTEIDRDFVLARYRLPP